MANARHWKDASTVILLAKLPRMHKGFNYKVLLMKRSAKSKFMANAAVFPGGICDKHDFSRSWEPLLFRFKKSSEQLLENRPRPSMFSNPEYTGLNPELGYRISAVRETFEESGVPLFKSSNTPELNPDEGPDEILTKVGANVLAKWRKQIEADGSKLIEMCLELNLVPDIWSLSTWSNWLTPTHMQSLHGKSPRRYDTMFYLRCLPYTPQHLADEREMVSSEWQLPTDALEMNIREEIWLAPPQIYELGRFCGIKDYEEILSYSQRRAQSGCEQWFPIRFNSLDGIINTLSGDSLYPTNPDFIGENEVLQVSQTMQESRLSALKVHRLEFRSKHDVDVFCNFDLPFDQISPSPGQEHKDSLSRKGSDTRLEEGE